ncbi:MAG: EamA family transporter [Succinivibrionaceae bacterium]|nr:EamA family transporter [Succinivibrionaceae bacterium]
MGDGAPYGRDRGSVRDHEEKLDILILSGIATGASWLCYYKALQDGDVSKVVPIDKLSIVLTLILAFVFLHEDFTWKAALGSVLITAGTLVMVL